MFLAFGEIMGRIAPPGHLRWRQTLPGSVNITWGGGEANVCASLAMFGQAARYLTALPAHPIAESITSTLRGLGVDTSHILWRKEGRLGLYFVESGANQRGTTVIYDRAYSAISLAEAGEYAFNRALDGVHWLHVTAGRINAAAYEQVARQVVDRFPNISKVAITLRESHSADHNDWGGMLYDAASQRASFAPLDASGEYVPYEMRNIVDRVGAGDSFAAGLLYALNSKDFASPDKAIAFAVAASCLKHSVHGDFNYVTRDEVIALMQGNATGRVQR